MKDIEFTATFGDQPKKVKLVAQAASAGHYDVHINDYRQGSIVKQKDGWVGYLNEKSILTADDILILGEMIDSQGPQK